MRQRGVMYGCIVGHDHLRGARSGGVCRPMFAATALPRLTPGCDTRVASRRYTPVDPDEEHPMQSGTIPWLLLVCLAATGCGVAPDADTSAADERGNQDPGPCVSYYADSDEIAGRGRLVQLDFSMRYAATRSHRVGGGDTSIVLDAQSQVEGKGSQLACAWDTPYGGVRYELVRTDGDEARPLPSTHSGTAMLKGTRVTQADGGTVREEVDMGGTMEAFRVVGLGPWEGADTRTCAMLWFDAPLQGRSLMRISAPGLQREEPMNPGALVDGYSALSPETYNSGDHRFVDQAFSICSGEPAQGLANYEPPAGMTISDDGQVWQRSGPWTQHASGPLEQRTVDFTLRVVPPTLALD